MTKAITFHIKECILEIMKLIKPDVTQTANGLSKLKNCVMDLNDKQ